MIKNSSNSSFKTNSKKRGVYVEKKTQQEAPNKPIDNQNEHPKKAPKRPSRGQKLFLASVFSLLSRSSTATQFPLEEKIIKTKKIKSDEIDNIEEVYKKNKSRYYEMENVKDYNKEQRNEEDTERGKNKKNKKYKSKILNIAYPSDSFEVLKYSKKNIIQTSSGDLSDDDDYVEDEELEKIKWGDFLPRLVKPTSDEIAIEKEKKMKHLLKEVSEGRKIKERRIQIEANEVANEICEEPCTLVSDNKKNTTKDPGFYNFFVDLLETTFSVYDIKSEYGMQSSAFSSKVDLEMDETVAKKLQVATDDSKHPSVHSIHVEKQNTKTYDQKYTNNDQFNKNYAPKMRRPKQFTKNKPKSDYLFEYKYPKPEPRNYLKSQSVSNAQKKTAQKKNKKQMLLNLLKEELSVPPFEEPQSLFEALKVLAKTQRKGQKIIRFEKKIDYCADDGFRPRKRAPQRLKKEKKSKNCNRQEISEINRRSFSTTKPSLLKPSKFNPRRRPIILEDEMYPNTDSVEVLSVNYDNYGRRVRKCSPDSNKSNFSPENSFHGSYNFE